MPWCGGGGWQGSLNMIFTLGGDGRSSDMWGLVDGLLMVLMVWDAILLRPPLARAGNLILGQGYQGDE